MITTLRQRNFALLWFGGLISLMGDWLLDTGLTFYIYDQTESTLAAGGLLVASFAPMVLLGSVAGVFVDRWDRKRTMMATNLIRTVIVLLLLLEASGGWLWVAYIVVFVQSAIAAFFAPAESALLPVLAGRDRLGAANSLNVLNNSIAKLLGPAVAGVLLGALGLPGVVLADSASFLVAGAMIGFIEVPSLPRAEEIKSAARSAWAAFWGEWLDGLRLVGRHSIVSGVFVVALTAAAANSILSALYPAWVKDILASGPQVFGLLTSAEAVGGLIGGVAVGHVSSLVRPGNLVAVGYVLAGVISLALWNLPYIPLLHLPIVPSALVLSTLVVVPVIASEVGQQTLLQTNVDDGYLGRVFAAHGTSVALLALLGSGVGGALGDVVGVLPLLNASACTYAVAGFAALVLLGGGRPRAQVTRETRDERYREGP